MTETESLHYKLGPYGFKDVAVYQAVGGSNKRHYQVVLWEV